MPGVGYAVAWMQYIWRLGATLVAAVIFFACAAMVFLKKDKPAAAPAPRATKITRLVPVPVRTITAMNAETQRIWAEHERWLTQAPAKARAA